MTSDRFAGDLFAGTYARGGAADAVTAEAWVRAMVDAEAALAAACVVEGLISPQAGEAILRALQQGPFDVDAIAAEAGEHATPVVPLVRELRERVGPSTPTRCTSAPPARTSSTRRR